MSEVSTAPVRARRTSKPEPIAEAPKSVPANGAATHTADVADQAAERPANFVRKPFGGVQYKLDNSQRTGYHRHWFNDKGNRIKDALDAGYNFVLGSDGKKMSHVVGVGEHGGGVTAYRMEIPLEWYEEDQRKKLAANDEKMQQIRNGVVAGVVPGQDGAYQPMNKAGTIGADIRVGNRK